MAPHACFAQEIADFLNGYGLNLQIAREIVFLITTDNHAAADGLVEVMATRGFRCDVEPDDGDFWVVNVRIVCVPALEQLERICQRFLAASEEFDCDVDGFRVQANELVVKENLQLESVLNSSIIRNEADAASNLIGPIIQELIDMGVAEEEFFDELGAISRACPALTRVTRMHQAIDLYRNQQYAGAYEMFLQLCDETPRAQRALLPLMAYCKFHLEEFQQAASLFEHAIVLRDGDDSDDAIDSLELTVHYGACLSRLGKFDEEVELYSRVLCQDPRHALAHYNMACHKSRHGDVDLCLMHLREALVSDPTLFPKAQHDRDLADVRQTSAFRAFFR